LRIFSNLSGREKGEKERALFKKKNPPPLRVWKEKKKKKGEKGLKREKSSFYRLLRTAFRRKVDLFRSLGKKEERKKKREGKGKEGDQSHLLREEAGRGKTLRPFFGRGRKEKGEKTNLALFCKKEKKERKEEEFHRFSPFAFREKGECGGKRNLFRKKKRGDSSSFQKNAQKVEENTNYFVEQRGGKEKRRKKKRKKFVGF